MRPQLLADGLLVDHVLAYNPCTKFKLNFALNHCRTTLPFHVFLKLASSTYQ
jgi:hypothetical protein